MESDKFEIGELPRVSMGEEPTTGRIVSKQYNRFEWIVSDDLDVLLETMANEKTKFLQSPFHLYERDGWRVRLNFNPALGSDAPVDVSVVNMNGSLNSLLNVQIGLMNEMRSEMRNAFGKTNLIGTYKIKNWAQLGDLQKMSATCNGRLLIFCELMKT